MNIPEAAVEAAVEAHCEGTMIAALEAAAPFIAAQALRDAAATFGECEPEGSYSSTPTQVITWLREHADRVGDSGD